MEIFNKPFKVKRTNRILIVFLKQVFDWVRDYENDEVVNDWHWCPGASKIFFWVYILWEEFWIQTFIGFKTLALLFIIIH